MTEKPLSEAEKIGQFAYAKLQQLQDGYLEGNPSSRAVLAQLRQATNKEPGTVWNLGEYLFMPQATTYFNRLDPAKDWGVTHQERALHSVMTLYAFHQQGRNAPMFSATNPFGKACALLAYEDGNNADHTAYDGMWKRLAKVAQASTYVALEMHLRQIIGLLKQAEVPLDYAGLAGDLYTWQFVSKRAIVQRHWGRQFYQRRPQAESTIN